MEDEIWLVRTKIMFQAMTYDMKLMYWNLKVGVEKVRKALGALLLSFQSRWIDSSGLDCFSINRMRKMV